MRVITLAMLLSFGSMTAVTAQSASGMDAMKYFVGTWTCKGAMAAGPTLDITLKFVMDSGILREWDEVRIPGTAAPYAISKSIVYDAKNSRWVQVQGDVDGTWIVSYLKPWTGKTEEWLGQASFDGKLGRDETIRTGANEFGFKNYANPADTKPDLDGTCTRST